MIIGLTGGIGSGKSYVANLFSELGVPIIDADQIAHALTANGGLAVQPIIEYFGSAYLTASGSVDRARLRQRVFQDPQALVKLNAITHPLIRAQLDEQTNQVQSAPYIIQVIPLLIESNDWKTRVDRILVVDCLPETQINRVMQRSQLERADVLAIMARQVSREQRLSCADDVIDNSENANVALAKQVQTLHQRYLQLADSNPIH